MVMEIYPPTKTAMELAQEKKEREASNRKRIQEILGHRPENEVRQEREAYEAVRGMVDGTRRIGDFVRGAGDEPVNYPRIVARPAMYDWGDVAPREVAYAFEPDERIDEQVIGDYPPRPHRYQGLEDLYRQQRRVGAMWDGLIPAAFRSAHPNDPRYTEAEVQRVFNNVSHWLEAAIHGVTPSNYAVHRIQCERDDVDTRLVAAQNLGMDTTGMYTLRTYINQVIHAADAYLERNEAAVPEHGVGAEALD